MPREHALGRGACAACGAGQYEDMYAHAWVTRDVKTAARSVGSARPIRTSHAPSGCHDNAVHLQHHDTTHGTQRSPESSNGVDRTSAKLACVGRSPAGNACRKESTSSHHFLSESCCRHHAPVRLKGHIGTQVSCPRAPFNFDSQQLRRRRARLAQSAMLTTLAAFVTVNFPLECNS